MTAIPSVQYTKNDDLTLAYQVTGNGRKDLVYLLFEWPNVVGTWFVQIGRASSELAQVADRRRLRFGGGRPETAELFRHAGSPLGMAFDPGGQPAPRVAASRDGREVVEGNEDPAARETLKETQRERRAANPAAGQAQRRSFWLEPMDRSVERRQRFRL
jgi:hypothetical protein